MNLLSPTRTQTETGKPVSWLLELKDSKDIKHPETSKWHANNGNVNTSISYHEMILIFRRAPTLGEEKGFEASELSLGLTASMNIAHEDA